MAATQRADLAQWVDLYPGIEYFYLLTKNGHLGYFCKDKRAVREVFPEKGDGRFLDHHPNFDNELAAFEQLVSQLICAYVARPYAGMELGYVLPQDDSKRLWKSATFVLHDSTLQHLRGDLDTALRSGEKDPFKLDSSLEWEKERSVQQGFDDIINHTDAWRIQTMFPVLFLLPKGMSDEVPEGSQPMRVLNLLWNSVSNGTRSGIFGPGGCADVFDIMQRNLLSRGAINRELRIDNRLSFG